MNEKLTIVTAFWIVLEWKKICFYTQFNGLYNLVRSKTGHKAIFKISVVAKLQTNGFQSKRDLSAEKFTRRRNFLHKQEFLSVPSTKLLMSPN